MRPHCHFIITLCVICCFFTAGCSSFFSGGDKGAGTTDNPVQAPAGYRATISQPDGRSAAVRMDADVYNAGEVVEFSVTNEGIIPLSCSSTPPDFVVKYQTGSGRWVNKMGPEVQPPGTTSYLQSGESTRIYRFITTGWEPGRYRIISDCGVSHEILVRSLPSLTPAGTACPPVKNTTPYLRADPVSDHTPGENFAIAGTTNLPAGEMLVYSVFSIGPGANNTTIAKIASSTVRVSAGRCNTNTWSVALTVPLPGQYFIGISNGMNTVSAIKRFTITPARPASSTTPGADPAGRITAG